MSPLDLVVALLFLLYLTLLAILRVRLSSLSSTAQVQLRLLALDNFWTTAPAQTYNFNAQFQLVSVYQGNTLEEQLTYDNGGNCQADSIYNQNQKVFRYFAYSML